MKDYIVLPFLFLKFWFWDAPAEIIGFFRSLNGAFNEAFSFTLFLKTFFSPLKNEYREGLIGFSRAVGIVVKSAFIIVDLLIFFVLITIELLVVTLFIAFPLITIAIVFI